MKLIIIVTSLIEEEQQHEITVPLSNTFEHRGYKWVIHRPVDNKKTWVVSELKTGRRACAVVSRSRKEAKEKFIKYVQLILDDKFNAAISKYPVINKEL